MRTAKGILEEIFLDGSARILCPPELIPQPGQYLLAHAGASDIIPEWGSSLPAPLFPSDSAPQGFHSAPPLPHGWRPGDSLTLRGPLGHGFTLPASARKVALIAFDDSPARLRGLLSTALRQNAEVVLVSDFAVTDLPEIVEVQPLKAILEILQWADYAAMDADRGNLSQLQEMLGEQDRAWSRYEAQVLIRAPMPCGALAECGVCALTLRREWKMVCKDGPVFKLGELL